MLLCNIFFANAINPALPPNFSISYNGPGCQITGNILEPIVVDNNGSGVPIGVYSATPSGLIIDPETGNVDAGASLIGNYVVKFQASTVFRNINLSILPTLTPTFNPIGNVCQNSIAPVLPTISTNNIAGSWFPAVINTTALGTTSYLFTPTSGQCGQLITLSVTISVPTTTPTFNIPTNFCKNVLLASLPSTSLNGVSGNWSIPTIDTSTVGQSTYIFTGSGQCIALYSLVVTINEPTIPDFQDIEISTNFQTAPILQNTSPNGISGTWNPTTVSTTTSGTYTFTPTPGQCAVTKTINVSVIYPVASTPPIFYTCDNGGGFGIFNLSDNNAFINPNTNLLIIVDYFLTLAQAQSIFPQSSLSSTTYTNAVALNQIIYAKVTDLSLASRPFSVVAVQLTVTPTLQSNVTSSNVNIYVDANDNVIQSATLSTIVQGVNLYQWYEGNSPIIGSSESSYVLNNYAGLALRSFKVNVRKGFNLNCQGFSNNITIGTIRVDTPFGNTTQFYNLGQTLNNLVVGGSNIRWYSNATTSPATLLPLNTLLTNGTTYYATQTIDGVESPTVLAVIAVLNQLDNQTFKFIDLKFSPNPVVDVLTIQSLEIIKNITILNILGQEVYNQKFNNLDMKIDLSSLVLGNYFLKIESDNKQMVSKIIKN